MIALRSCANAAGLDILSSKDLESQFIENSYAISCIKQTFFSNVEDFEFKFAANSLLATPSVEFPYLSLAYVSFDVILLQFCCAGLKADFASMHGS